MLSLTQNTLCLLYTSEQGEEEKNAADLITKMELFGGDSKGLYMLNSELKARVYTCLLYTSPRSHHFRRSVPKSSRADCKQTQETQKRYDTDFRLSLIHILAPYYHR